MSKQRKENLALRGLIGVVLVWLVLATLSMVTQIPTVTVVAAIIVSLLVWFLLWLLEGGAVARAKRAQYRAGQAQSRHGDAGESVLLLSPDGTFLVLSPEERMGPYLRAGYRKVKLPTS